MSERHILLPSHFLAYSCLPWIRYGMVLAKEKNEDKAMDYFVRSVHLYPMNWGCWLEMTQLISRIDDVSFWFYRCVPGAG